MVRRFAVSGCSAPACARAARREWCAPQEVDLAVRVGGASALRVVGGEARSGTADGPLWHANGTAPEIGLDNNKAPGHWPGAFLWSG